MDRLILFETALLAKELGFNNPVQNRYLKDGKLNNNSQRRYGEPINYNDPCFQDEYRSYTSAPTQSELRFWLREEFNIDIVIQPTFACYNIIQISEYDGIEDENNSIVAEEGLEFGDFFTYESALEYAFEVCLKITIDENKE